MSNTSTPTTSDIQDAARFREIARRFDSSTTGRSERILEDLGLDPDDAIQDLAVIIDAAIAARGHSEPAGQEVDCG